VGYLLKPVRREKLERAVRHAARIAGPQLARLAEQSQLGRRRVQISARLGEQLRLVPVDDVLYFSAGQKYVTVRHRGGRELIDESLRALEQEFAPDFIRIHRNSLVARRYVRAVERSDAGQLLVRFTAGDDALPVSRRHAAEALRQLRTGQ
jgi:two-component system response regulator AlgR